MSRLRGLAAARLTWPVALALILGACGNDTKLVTSETPLAPADSVEPPAEPQTPPPSPPPDTTAPSDTTTAPPPDSPTPPQDTIGAPPPPMPAPPPVHVGVPFGPAHAPWETYGPVISGALQNGQPERLLYGLEAARWASTRVMVSLTGSSRWFTDANGFNMAQWKQRVDRYRGMDFSSYVDDGTFAGHFILDEPADLTNWNGHRVSTAQIEEMARYSKEIWPSLPVIVRAWPHYLAGYRFKHLDATWIQYHERFGDIEAWMDKNVKEARAMGLAVVGGLNSLNGGGKKSGMPSYRERKHAMNPSQLKSWGGRFLQEELCLFVFWEYHPDYFSRPDIKAAMEELSSKARARPKRACRN